MKASICAPSARCTGSWPRTSRCESGAISAVIPATPSPSWWPRAPTRLVLGYHPAPGPKRWTSFYLYVLLDIFSRCVVGWMVADRENAALAATLIEETCLKQGIEPQVLTLHSDRGRADDQQVYRPTPRRPRGHPLSEPPQVSDDNPFSEAQFKTLKYHPGFPGRFEDITAAIAFCRSFFPGTTPSTAMPGSRCSPPMMSAPHRAIRMVLKLERGDAAELDRDYAAWWPRTSTCRWACSTSSPGAGTPAAQWCAARSSTW